MIPFGLNLPFWVFQTSLHDMELNGSGVGIQEGRCKATWKRRFKLPWREAGPPNHHDDKVVSGHLFSSHTSMLGDI